MLQTNILASSIDWKNSVFIPLCFAGTINLVLAVYCGLVATRAYTFFQLRLKSASVVIEISRAIIRTATGPHDTLREIVAVTFPVLAELRAAGHHRTADQLAEIINDYSRAMCKFLGVEMPKDRLPEFSDVSNEMQGKLWEFMNHRWKARGHEEFARMIRAKPNLLPIITLRPFPEYILNNGTFEGLMSAPQSKWRKFAEYVDGVRSDFNL